MVKARDNGLIGGIGLSNITREHLVHARAITGIACIFVALCYAELAAMAREGYYVPRT